MKTKCVAILIDAEGVVSYQSFDRYNAAETFVRESRKTGKYVNGWACESRYAFEIKAEDLHTIVPDPAQPDHEPSDITMEEIDDLLPEIPDESDESDESTDEVKRGRGRPRKV